MEFEVGALYRFNYLWARESERGEESGRKSRPTCLLFRAPGEVGRLYLFPVTSSPVQAGRAAMPIAAAECQIAGLRHPSWVMLDEVNIALANQLYDFASVKPVGRFSRAFLKELIAAAREQATGGTLSTIHRK